MSILNSASALLRLFEPTRTVLTVTEVSRLLAMPKSSVSRLMRSMKENGFLSGSGAEGFSVGPLLFEVSRLHRAQSSLTDLVEEALRAVVEKTGHTGYISILDGRDVLVVRVQPGTRALQVVTPLGSRSASHATAIGRSLLARFSDAEVRTMFSDGVDVVSRTSPRDVEDLLARLAEVRERHWAEASNEGVPGVGSIAISVSDPAYPTALGLCLSYSASLTSTAERRSIAALLVEVGEAIGAKVSDPFWVASSAPRKPGKGAPAGRGKAAGAQA